MTQFQCLYCGYIDTRDSITPGTWCGNCGEPCLEFDMWHNLEGKEPIPLDEFED